MIPLPFLKKKKEVKRVYIPVDLVLNYASQGLSEGEITLRLKEQGFEQQYIDRAMRIALKERISPETLSHNIPDSTVPATAPNSDYHMATPLGLEPPQPMAQAPPQITRRPQPVQQPQQPQQIAQAPPMGMPPERVVSPQGPRHMSPKEARDASFTFEGRDPQRFHSAPEEITIEELIEGIVDERWRDFEERLIDFEKRDMQLESEIADMRKTIREFKGSLSTKDEGLITKLDEFSGSVDNIEGRIGSIEKVFKDFLPELTQNIKSMSDLVEKIKEERK